MQYKNLKFVVKYPKGFDEGKKYPTILFLHGAGSRGDDLTLIENNPYFKAISGFEDFEFITFAPQCFADTWFDIFEQLKDFAKHISALPYVDQKRLYCMGASMGGYATWQLAMSLPQLFAAIVPICGGGMYWNAARLVGVPAWAFHGEKDKTVFLEESRKMVNAVNKAGGNARLTTYPESAHNSWDETYQNRAVFNWLLENEKTCGDNRTEFNDPLIYG